MAAPDSTFALRQVLDELAAQLRSGVEKLRRLTTVEPEDGGD